jgi:predicted secreted protein
VGILPRFVALSTVFFAGACAEAGVVTAERRIVLTDADDGREVRVPVGAAAQLRLTRPWTWSELRVAGDAIEAVRVRYESDPGFVEWELRARRAGRAVVEAEGTRDGTDGATTRRFSLVLLVVP